MELEPYSLAVLGERLVVGGTFATVVPNPSGGGSIRAISPMLVFSTTTGSLLRPTDSERVAWFPIQGWNAVAFDMLHTDAGLVVAFGSPGLGVFDATTLDWDATASAPYFDPTWWLPDYGNAIYALALPGSPQGTLAASAVGSPGKLVIGGSIARWKDRVAGNVVRTTIGADTVAPTASGPRAVPRAGFSLTSAAVPVKVLWTGADLHGSGVASYDLAVSVSGSAYTTLRTGVASPTLDTSFASGKTYRFRVRARDFAGNVGAWVTGATLSGSLVQQTSSSIRFSTGWTTLSNTSYSGGTAKARSIAGAAVSYTFTGRVSRSSRRSARRAARPRSMSTGTT